MNMLESIDLVVAIPTWAMTNALAPILPKGHPWKGRWFTLTDWRETRTDFTRQLDMIMWVGITMAICVMISLRFR